jgi:ADP-dependent NAD(P)H-hydrate dehydratase / NAD(P)H-hydrate epimerase
VALPAWLDPLFDAEEMGAADSFATEQGGVPSLELMERAGEGLARTAAELADASGREGPIRVVVGKGNNGGDGLVAARVLREQGRAVEVLSTAPLDEFGGGARANLDRLPGDPPVEGVQAERLTGSAAVIDALLGTGFSGKPREPAASAIALMAAQDAPVVACDAPSGVDASTGVVEGEAVRATVTATFHAPKIGLHVAPGALHAGEVRTIEIGIPRDAPSAQRAGLISERVLELVPSRARAGSKFDAGVVVVAGGMRGLTGAPTMAALAAMRTGAGYVQLAVPESTQTVFALKLMEAMTVGQPEAEGAHSEAGADGVEQLAERAGAVVLGPGIGRSDGAVAFARAVAQRVEAPLVIDADGLNAHAGRLEDLRGRPGPTVLTPHAGELGRLLESDSRAVGARRLESAREAAERSGAILVLKGDDTIVATPEGLAAVSRGGSPALATAGTGDVLCGVIGAFLAKGLDAFAAVAGGVLAHARAGRVAAARFGADHTVAADVIDAIPAALGGPARARERRAAGAAGGPEGRRRSRP